jgi:hypothetical protein
LAEYDLGHGRIVLLDDDDLPLLDGRSWHARKSGDRLYAATKEVRGGRGEITYLHRLIAGADRERIGFRNGNSLDCRRDNLRIDGLSRPEKTYARGALGEAMVIADLARHGHDVFVPVSGHTAADLISISPANQVIRWQVKLRATGRSSTSLTVSLKAVHPLKGRYLRKAYDLEAVDGFAIYCPDPEAVYYVPVSDINKNCASFSICLGPNAKRSGSRDARIYQSPNIK